MKNLAKCESCDAYQVVRTEHVSPNGQHNCGMCNKPSITLLSLLFIIGLAFPAITVGCSNMGWDSIEACGALGTNVSYISVTNITQISNIIPGHINSIEVLGVLGILILILFGAATASDNMRILGVFASLIMLMLGIMVYTDGIVYKTGDTSIGTNNVLKSISALNSTTNESATLSLNETSTNQYSYMTVPYVDFGQFLGTVLILLSMFGMLHYALGVGRFLNQGK